MAAVAVRENLVRREEAAGTAMSSGRRVRRRKNRLRKLTRLCIPIIVVASFVYVGLYASVTAASYRKSKLIDLCRQERIMNERLTVEMIRRSSPRYVTAAAQKSGMVCATQYDYLHGPPTVASAGSGD
jgi:hypothetical protein